MNDDELRDIFAAFRGMTGASPEECYEFANAMLEAKKIKSSRGIVAVKPKRRSKDEEN